MRIKHFIATALMALTSATITAHAKIIVTDPWTRATVEGQTMGGAFMTLTNTGRTDARLIGVSSPVSDHMELHVMANNNGMMSMSHTPSVNLPAGQTITLKPKDTHVMFMGLKRTLSAGSQVPMVLRIKEKGRQTTIRIRADVRALAQ